MPPQFYRKKVDRMNEKTDYIAVFDSGVGGLSVLRHLQRLCPKERYLYFGDSCNAPYGNKNRQEIKNLTLAAAEKLCSRGIKALVVACNTATSAAISDLRKKYPELIVVGIEPALKLAADRYPGGTVGIMATQATLELEKLSHLMTRVCRGVQVVKLPAPGLVELIEAGKGEGAEAEALLRPILSPWAGKLDALVLGCTHYPFASGTISGLVGRHTQLLDGGEGTARQTLRLLEQRGLLNTAGPGEILLENSLGTPEILELSQKLLQE